MKKIILSLLLCFSLNAFAAELHLLVKSGKVDQVREYLKAHPEHVNYEDYIKRTPLVYAVIDGNVDLVQLLIDHDADVNHEDYFKETPLFDASLKGHVEVVRLLIGRGADVNHENKLKQTPLFKAAEDGNVDRVRLLLDCGANNPFDIYLSKRIKEKGNQEIIQLLKDKNLLTDDPDEQVPAVTFADIGGYEGVKAKLTEYISMVKNSKRYKEFGIEQAPHTLLYGPPGTGKTLFAMATAGECNFPFLLVSGSELSGPYLGESAERIRDTFAKIKQKARENKTPGFLIIDELDSIGGDRRNFIGNVATEQIATLNQLLTELDGGNNKGNSQELAGTVLVIGITNFIEILDPALLRAGRLGRHIFVGLPNKEERQLILETYKRYPLSSDVDFSVIAEETDGFSGADLAQLLEEAALAAVKNPEQDDITMSDILTALDAYKASRSMSLKNPLVEFGELFEAAVKERSRL